MNEKMSNQAETGLPRAVIALGENIKIGISPEHIRQNPQHLSIYSKEIAMAAAIEYYEGNADVIIFSEGHTAGEEYPSGAHAMADYAQKFYRNHFHNLEISKEHIILEETSKDTSTQAEEIKTMAEGKYEISSLIAASFHMRRTKGIFNAFQTGINKFIPAEDAVSRISWKHNGLMNKQTSPFNYKLLLERVKEFGLNSARYVLLDPGQKRLRFLTHKSRN